MIIVVIVIVIQLSANRIDNVDVSFNWSVIVGSRKALKEGFKMRSLVAKFHVYAQLIKLGVYNNVCVGVDNKRKENLNCAICCNNKCKSRFAKFVV